MNSGQEWQREKDRFVAGTEEDMATPWGPLARQFASLTRSLLDTGTVEAVLERVVSAAHEIVRGADVVSVTLCAPDGELHTPAQTDPVAGELDRLQYQHHEGACVDAAQVPGPACAYSDDLAVDERWPVFGPAAADRGFRSLVCTALPADGRTPRFSGSLNVYCRRPRGLTAADRDVLLLLATHASLALATTRAVTGAHLRITQLRRALASRDAIGQAKGILMQRRGISAEEAFDILRRTSQEINVKLAEIAETLASRHDELDQPEPGSGRGG